MLTICVKDLRLKIYTLVFLSMAVVHKAELIIVLGLLNNWNITVIITN